MPISAGEPLLDVQGLRAGYGKIAVLHGVSLRIAPGETDHESLSPPRVAAPTRAASADVSTVTLAPVSTRKRTVAPFTCAST